MIAPLGQTASGIVVVLGVLAIWALLAQGIAAVRAVRVAKATGLDPKSGESARVCRCDGYAMSMGSGHEPGCPERDKVWTGA